MLAEVDVFTELLAGGVSLPVDIIALAEGTILPINPSDKGTVLQECEGLQNGPEGSKIV